MFYWWIELSLKCASLMTQMAKNPPAMRETWVLSLGWEEPLQKETVTHFSILTWRIPGTKEPGTAKRSQRVRHDWATFTYIYTCILIISFSLKSSLVLIYRSYSWFLLKVWFIFFPSFYWITAVFLFNVRLVWQPRVVLLYIQSDSFHLYLRYLDHLYSVLLLVWMH